MKLTEEQKKEVVKLYRSGKTSDEIGETYKVSYVTITRILHTLGESVRKQGPKPNGKNKREIVELYRSGKSTKEIAEIYNVSTVTINSALRGSGEKRRKHAGKKFVFEEKQGKDIAELYRAGKTCVEIAKTYNSNPATIYSTLVRMEEPRRRRAARGLMVIEKQKQDIIELYRSGKTGKEIGKIYKTDAFNILRYLGRWGEQKRGGGHIKTIGETCICKICNNETPISEMQKSPSAKCGIGAICKKCDSERHNKSERHFMKYGISRENYLNMLQKQNYKCAICGNSDGGRSNSGGSRRFAIDHSHDTGKVRGLLCDTCNRAIGMLKDDPEILEKAKQYLLKHV